MKLLLFAFLSIVLIFHQAASDDTLITITSAEIYHKWDTIRLRCAQRKNDPKQRIWKMNGNLLAVDRSLKTSNPRMKVESNGDLIITTARFEDSGRYQCIIQQRPPFSYITNVVVKARDITLSDVDDRLFLVEDEMKAAISATNTKTSSTQTQVDKLEKELRESTRTSSNTISIIQTKLQSNVNDLKQTEQKINSRLGSSETKIEAIRKQLETLKADTQRTTESIQRQINALNATDAKMKTEIERNTNTLTNNLEHLQREISSTGDKTNSQFSSLNERLKGLTKENRESKFIVSQKISHTDHLVQELAQNLNASEKLNAENIFNLETQLKDLDRRFEQMDEKSETFATRKGLETQLEFVKKLEDHLKTVDARLTTMENSRSEELEGLFSIQKLEDLMKKKDEYMMAMDVKIRLLNRTSLENQRNIALLTDQLGKAMETFATQSATLQQSVDALVEESQSRTAVPSTLLPDNNVAMLASHNSQMVTIYTWHLHDLQSHLITAGNSTNMKYYVESKLFYTAIPGYRLVLRLYPNYKRSGHVGLFAGLRVGEFDDVIPWPFKDKYVLSMRMGETGTLIDEKEIDPVQSPACKTKIRRPHEFFDGSCGFQSFVSHERLNEYVKNNESHLQIGIMVHLASL